jgi:hypothetical protein
MVLLGMMIPNTAMLVIDIIDLYFVQDGKL